MIEDLHGDVQQRLTEMVLADHAFDDDDLLARAAYLITQSHEEGPDRELANALFTELGISPRKNRRRGRPRKRSA